MPLLANAYCTEDLDLESLEDQYGVSDVFVKEIELINQVGNRDEDSVSDIEL